MNCFWRSNLKSQNSLQCLPIHTTTRPTLLIFWSEKRDFAMFESFAFFFYQLFSSQIILTMKKLVKEEKEICSHYWRKVPLAGWETGVAGIFTGVYINIYACICMLIIFKFQMFFPLSISIGEFLCGLKCVCVMNLHSFLFCAHKRNLNWQKGTGGALAWLEGPPWCNYQVR